MMPDDEKQQPRVGKVIPLTTTITIAPDALADLTGKLVELLEIVRAGMANQPAADAKVRARQRKDDGYREEWLATLDRMRHNDHRLADAMERIAAVMEAANGKGGTDEPIS